MEKEHAVVLFDGVCNFCNSRVNFMIRNDKKDHFRFTPLQSEAGQKILKQAGLPADHFDSFVLYENGKTYQRTSAALRIARHLRFPWFLFYPFIFIPPFLRDWLYHLIAKNRYKWWGKKESCMIPTPEVRSRFL